MRLRAYGAAGVVALGMLLGCRGSPEDAPVGAPALAGPPPANPQAAALLVRAQGAFEGAAFGEALAFADSAESLAPAAHRRFRADVAFLRGRVYAEMKQPDSAEVAYERVLALEPAYRGVWRNRGNAAFRQGQYRQALAHYHREQAVRPDAQTWIYVGRSYAELGAADSARHAYERALAMEAEGDVAADAHLRLARLYDAGGDAERALAHAHQARALDPSNPDHAFLVGALLLRVGEPGEALTHLQAAMNGRPAHQPTLFNAAQALVRLGRPGEAEPLLAAADSLRRLEGELTRWETMTRLHPDDPAAWATYGYALRYAGRDAEARRAYGTALHLDPANLELRFQAANLALYAGDLDGALRHYAVVLEQDSTLADAWVNVGIAHARAGRPEAARAAWQAALRVAPDHPNARDYLARLEAR